MCFLHLEPMSLFSSCCRFIDIFSLSSGSWFTRHLEISILSRIFFSFAYFLFQYCIVVLYLFFLSLFISYSDDPIFFQALPFQYFSLLTKGGVVLSFFLLFKARLVAPHCCLTLLPCIGVLHWFPSVSLLSRLLHLTCSWRPPSDGFEDFPWLVGLPSEC